jgi:type II secretion system protein H
MILPTGKLSKGAFTLIELILVMTLLAVAISFIAPRLAAFFRGRSLDSEARQLLALTRHAQSRAVSEGIPMRVWFDVRNRTYGLEAQPGFVDFDTNAVEFALDRNVQIDVAETRRNTALPVSSTDKHSNLPALSFRPDGSLAESSPQSVQLRDRDGVTLWLAQSRSRLNYELRNQTNLWNDARW